MARTADRERSIVFFNRPGYEYPDNMTVRVFLKDGDALQYLVASPAERLGYCDCWPDCDSCSASREGDHRRESLRTALCKCEQKK